MVRWMTWRVLDLESCPRSLVEVLSALWMGRERLPVLGSYLSRWQVHLASQVRSRRPTKRRFPELAVQTPEIQPVPGFCPER